MERVYEFWFDGSYESLQAKAVLIFDGDGLNSFDLLWVRNIDGHLIQIDDTVQREASKYLFANEKDIIAKLFDNTPDYSMDDVSMTRVS